MAEATSRSVMVTVTEVVDETADARSLVLAIPEYARDRWVHRPGQFLTLRVPSDETGSVARCYSLASSPHYDAAPKVTVKRTKDGYGSNWLCDNVSAGDVLEVLPPAGTFTPDDMHGDVALWAAGSGITPVLSILKSLLAVGTGRIALVYANRDERSVIFSGELRDLGDRHPDRLTVLHWLESVQGLPSHAQLAGHAARLRDRDHYLCGPAPFMATVQSALGEVDVPRARIHVEVFASLSGDPFAVRLPVAADGDGDGASELEVDLDGHVHHLRWPRQSTLVEVLLAAGVDVPYSCREGQCGSCACTVTDGEVAMERADILQPEDLADGIVLGCQARPVSDCVRVEF
ncbi:ferredoxin--NADP reductase [Mycobacterium hodleri]|uniref:ferredoxin--NADP reductase n=1 Tax=Mycolicibacterium hodleri TaxID=49897 RepID=UPI0021F3A893|nr:ferredoxin--NADP reductase [Mycolicibacterium hodleri]MCV7136217.1 ferredoxin--NADP reductase [Mycolicibacterium hodleri]